MALKARITAVTHTVTADDGDGGTTQIDLSMQGELLVTAEYFDDSAPSNVIHTQRFQIPSTEDETQIAGRVIAFGARARDARVRVAELTVYIGATLDIP